MIDHDNLEAFADPLNYDNEGSSDTGIAVRFTFPQELEALLNYNGFTILRQYGDWNLEPLTGSSPSIISVCRKRGRSEHPQACAEHGRSM